MIKSVIIIVFLAIVIGVLYWGFGSQINNLLGSLSRPKEVEIITLEYWGLRDDEATLKPVFEAYQQTHPNVKINYTKQSLLNYRTRVQTQIRSGQGPDIYQIHNSWTPMFTPDLYPMPGSVMSLKDFTSTFFPVVEDSLVLNNKVYAIPLRMDGLVLFYNEDILKGANINPPQNWFEFAEAAKKMTVKNEAGQIQTAGGALGTTRNVDYWPEIVGLLIFQQPNDDILNPNNQYGAEVLQFYSGFMSDAKNKIWDQSLPSSSQMFVNGRLALYFAPSRVASDIISANPSLKFKTIPAPQLPGRQVGWASFYSEGVSIQSKHPEESWDLLKFMSSADNLRLMNKQRSDQRILSEAYPRVDIAGEQSGDPILGAVVNQGGFFKSWFLNSDTQDAGLNDEMITVLQKAVDSSAQGRDYPKYLLETSGGFAQIYNKYTYTPPK